MAKVRVWYLPRSEYLDILGSGFRIARDKKPVLESTEVFDLAIRHGTVFFRELRLEVVDE